MGVQDLDQKKSNGISDLFMRVSGDWLQWRKSELDSWENLIETSEIGGDGITPSYLEFLSSTILNDAITYVAGKVYYINADAGIDFDAKVDYLSIPNGAKIGVAVYGNGGNRAVDFSSTTNNLDDGVTIVSGRTGHFEIKNFDGTIHTLLNDIS